MIEEKPHYKTLFKGYQGSLELDGIIYDIYPPGFLQFKDWDSGIYCIEIKDDLKYNHDSKSQILWTILKMRDLI